MLSYGSGDISGNIGTDALCVTKDDCAKNLRFMLGLEQSGLSFLRSSGVIGLSPGNEGFDNTTYDLYIDKMVQSGTIDKKIFSISISPDSTTQSAVTFGGYDTDKFATGNLTWHDTDKSSMYWTLRLESMSVSIDTYSGETDYFTRDPPYV